MQKSIHFTSVSGSLRKGSFINTRLLHSPAGLLMKLLTTVRILFDSRPIYQANPDLTKSKERSAARITFRNKLAATDALVISSTRYNYSIRDGLKNFMD